MVYFTKDYSISIFRNNAVHIWVRFNFFRQKAALDTGLNYPDLMLAFKLLRDSCLGLEVNMAVLAKLQSCQTGFIEDYVTQTSTCLIDICVKQAGQVKTELEVNSCSSVESGVYIFLFFLGGGKNMVK